MSRPDNGLAGTSSQVADDGGFYVYLALHDFNLRTENRGLSPVITSKLRGAELGNVELS